MAPMQPGLAQAEREPCGCCGQFDDDDFDADELGLDPERDYE